jgi:hypothetical protein
MTFDYQTIAPQGTSKEARQAMRVGDLFENAAVCHSCEEYIRSHNKHDFATCSCGSLSVDGGSFYAKRAFTADTGYTDFITEYQ